METGNTPKQGARPKKPKRQQENQEMQQNPESDLGLALRKKGDQLVGTKHLGLALRKKGDQLVGTKHLGLALRKKGDQLVGTKHLGLALRKKGDQLVGTKHLGLALRKMGDDMDKTAKQQPSTASSTQLGAKRSETPTPRRNIEAEIREFRKLVEKDSCILSTMFLEDRSQQDRNIPPENISSNKEEDILKLSHDDIAKLSEGLLKDIMLYFLQDITGVQVPESELHEKKAILITDQGLHDYLKIHSAHLNAQDKKELEDAAHTIANSISKMHHKESRRLDDNQWYWQEAKLKNAGYCAYNLDPSAFNDESKENIEANMNAGVQGPSDQEFDRQKAPEKKAEYWTECRGDELCASSKDKLAKGGKLTERSTEPKATERCCTKLSSAISEELMVVTKEQGIIVQYGNARDF